jgi:hypothetical protein
LEENGGCRGVISLVAERLASGVGVHSFVELVEEAEVLYGLDVGVIRTL